MKISLEVVLENRSDEFEYDQVRDECFWKIVDGHLHIYRSDNVWMTENGYISRRHDAKPARCMKVYPPGRWIELIRHEEEE